MIQRRMMAAREIRAGDVLALAPGEPFWMVQTVFEPDPDNGRLLREFELVRWHSMEATEDWEFDVFREPDREVEY